MMGRVKLKINKLENTAGRPATFAKRRNGILKKVYFDECIRPCRDILLSRIYSLLPSFRRKLKTKPMPS
ncbi:hypothetical protein HA466_0082380 [Hirschfeldia incana]|nr:hypothetical protein HA466_0082380 [Hirschfeldia incana]